jgi:hypothetical protein
MIPLPLMENSGRPLPPDDDPEERARQARLALMGVHSNLMGSAAGLDPNSKNYLPVLGRHVTGMNLISAAMPSPATKEDSTTIPAQPNAGGASLEPAEPRPAGVMGKSSLMGNLPLTRNVQDAALLDRPAAVTMGVRDRMARPAAPVAAPVAAETEMPTRLVPPDREPVLANPAPSMGARPHHSLMGKIVRGLETAGNIAGDVFFPGPMSLIPHTQLYNERQAAAAERNRLAEGRVESELMGARARLMGTPEEQAYRYGLGQGETPTQAYRELHPQRMSRETPDEQLIEAEETFSNPAASTEERADAQRYVDAARSARGILHPAPAKGERILTNPFEASLYGTPEQKKAAQDFLAFEKRIGARYQRPTEFDERYRLFTEHPDIYKAMYGTKGGISPAEARMMLNYFDKRRQEINKDYTLSDADRQQALQEVEQLEQPFMDAARAAAGQGVGASESDTVNVISPTGVPGTIPRKNLQKALKRGYRQAQ